MPRLARTALIHHPADAVWAFLIRRENSPLIVPGLVRVWDVAPAEPAVGQTWRFTYTLLGQTFEGRARMTALEPGRSFEFETGAELVSRWTYRVAVAGPHCSVTIAVDYTLPAAIKESATLEGLHQARMAEILRNLEAKLRR